MKKIGIVGSGLVGSLQAILMAKKGYDVTVFENRPDLRKAKLLAGKSINLALSDRGLKALREAGIEDDIKEIVFVWEDGKVKPIMVKSGIQDNTYIQI